MAFAELHCRCESAMQLDFDDNDDAMWLMVLRFAEAHIECGYINPVPTAPDSEQTVITIDDGEGDG